MEETDEVDHMTEIRHTILETSSGTFKGNETEGCREFLGIPYAAAERFRYARIIDTYEGVTDATSFGNVCPSFRQYFPDLENRERLFYYREFRKGLEFSYDEDCLNLNIYTPMEPDNCPVVIFIHGGGFNSGGNSEEPFRGYELAKRGIITVFINYRVGILGYLTHEDIRKEYGRNGNFGLDDQRTAILWVRKHIREFGGDPDNITLAGQSAGAISIQYLCLDHHNEGMFRRVLMMSGGGLFPKFALPRYAEDTEKYWQELMEKAGCRSLEELRKLDIRELLSVEQEMKQEHRDTLYNTMPVVDGYLLERPADRMISDPLDIGYMISYTNNDMYAPVMAYIGNQFGRKNDAYLCYFDLDAPGDNNGAFHSSDLRYWFGRLSQSWRPYGSRDREVSKQMMDYLASYAENGDPNGEGRPEWQPCHNGRTKILHISRKKTAMGRVNMFRLGRNMIRKGSPKA